MMSVNTPATGPSTEAGSIHMDRGGLAGTVRADDLVDLGGHQLVQDTEPDADRQRHQALLRCAGQLAESPLDAVGQLASPVLLSHGDLLGRYVPHGGSSCPRCWTSTPRTLSARADEAGGPPPPVLRGTGHARLPLLQFPFPPPFFR